MALRRIPAGPSDVAHAEVAARRLAQLGADLAGAQRERSGSLPRLSSTAPGAAGVTTPAWLVEHTRIANGGLLRDDRADTEPALHRVEVPVVPQPGRHASRRRRAWPAGHVVARWRGRAPALSPTHVTVVALVVAAALGLTTWWVLRDRPEQITNVSAEPVAPLVGLPTSPDPTSPSRSAGSAGSPAPGGEASGTVTVDVAGKVRRPGIVVLAQGARVTDAIEQAGGPRRGVDLTSINLARVLIDGEQIVVGAAVGVTTGAGAHPGGTGTGGSTATPLVNLNLAARAELETLPGVGPVTAEAILAWREQHGGFTSIDELLEIDGIGDKTLTQLAPHVTV